MDSVGLPNVKNLYDVRMDQGCGVASFLEKSLLVVGAVDKVAPQDLERHVAVEIFLKRQIDIGHAAPSKPMDDAIAGHTLIA
jgi:hypothetical protein